MYLSQPYVTVFTVVIAAASAWDRSHFALLHVLNLSMATGDIGIICGATILILNVSLI